MLFGTACRISIDDWVPTILRLFRLLAHLGCYSARREILTRPNCSSTAVLTLVQQKYPDMLEAAFLIAEALSEASCFEQAESCYLRCLSLQEELYGSNHASTLRTVRALAMLMTNQDRYEEAIDFRYRNLAWVRDQYGADHRLTLVEINQLAWDLRKAKRFLESERLYREFLSRSPRVLDPGDLEIGFALLGLAQTLEKTGQNAEALIIRERHREYRSALKKVG